VNVLRNVAGRWDLSGAGAVDAGVFGAEAANEGELLPERLTSAMDADCSIARGNFCLGCEGFKTELGQIDVAEDLAVGGLHGGEHLFDAFADDLLGFRVGSSLGCEVLCPALKGAIFGCAVSVVVDDGVAQDAVEPRKGGLLAAEVGRLFDGTDIRALKDVLRGGRRVDMFLHEVEEQLPLGDEAGDHISLHGAVPVTSAV
jgi:hypothetical protein